MRIIIDMQGAQSESRFRGIGRYALSFAQAVARNRGDLEIILILNGLLADSIEPMRTAFEGLLPQRNIVVWDAPGPVARRRTGNEGRAAAAVLLWEHVIAGLQPDVVHLTSLFEGFVDDSIVRLGDSNPSWLKTVTVYDFIPLHNAKQYLANNEVYERFYRQKLADLQRADEVFAISKSSAREVTDTLGIPSERVICTYGGVGEAFTREAKREASDVLSYRERWGIRSGFVLYVGGADERKNIPRLIEAYAGLSAELRTEHQLVLAGRMTEADIAQLTSAAYSVEFAPDELVFTGYVSDDELANLYRECTLFVFPSWHEGFGLPVLEAMACGAPVIAARATSIPEIVGLDDALFDPFDVVGMTALIAQCLSDDEFRSRLIENAYARASEFSWDEAAHRAIRAWRGFAKENPAEKPHQNLRDWSSLQCSYGELYRQLIGDLVDVARLNNKLDSSVLIDLAASLVINERSIFDYWRRRPLPETLVWRIEGPFDSTYSLALLNRELARALAGLGHDVVLHSTEGPGDFTPADQFLRLNPDLSQWNGRSQEVSQARSDVTSRNLFPPRVKDMACAMNALHAYGWEESGFPPEWVAEFNDSLQGITTMSEHVRKTLVDNGVAVPIAVSGVGVDHWERVNADLTYALPAGTRGFRFLHVSSCFPRKGADVLLAAYGRAFSIADDVTLIIKTFPNPHNRVHRWLEEARGDNDQYPDVQIIEDELTDAELKALYEHCDALVAPSRAEGFGLPMAEAMLSGLPVITTAWSGQMDFCNEQNSWLVDYQFAPSQSHFDVFDSVWAEPDVGHLATRMKEVFEAPSDVRRIRAAAGRRLLLGRFCWRNVAERLVSATRIHSDKGGYHEPKIGWVSTWNTKCGIASYSRHLVKGMSARVRVFAPLAERDDLTRQDENYVERCWATDPHDDLERLRQAVATAHIDMLVIQFNYAFFGFSELSRFINRLSLSGCKIVLMMHATVDPPHRTDLRLSDLVSGLSRCHRVLVHTPADMNRLLALGLSCNVALFPHGIVDFTPEEEDSRRQSRGFEIASYGFFLPHKGLLELVEAIADLRRAGANVRLKMLNAEYPAPESTALIETVIARINKLGLRGYVDLNTEYLPELESLTQLSGADLIVFPYQETGESSSAAVRTGIASGTQVAVTPLEIFDDVRPAVHTLPGCSSSEIASGVLNLLTEQLNVQGEKTTTARWREAHRYPRVARRLQSMLKALCEKRDFIQQ